MDWLLSTIEAISINISRQKSAITQEEQYCNTLCQVLEEAEKEKEKLNAKIVPLLEAIDACRRRHANDDETRTRLLESAGLAREKERQEELERMTEKENQQKIREKIAASQKQHQERIDKLKMKFPNLFHSSEEDVKYLNQLRAKKNKLKESIMNLEVSLSAPENKDWSLFKQLVVRLAELIFVRNQVYQSYGMDVDITIGSETEASEGKLTLNDSEIPLQEISESTMQMEDSTLINNLDNDQTFNASLKSVTSNDGISQQAVNNEDHLSVTPAADHSLIPRESDQNIVQSRKFSNDFMEHDECDRITSNNSANATSIPSSSFRPVEEPLRYPSQCHSEEVANFTLYDNEAMDLEFEGDMAGEASDKALIETLKDSQVEVLEANELESPFSKEIASELKVLQETRDNESKSVDDSLRTANERETFLKSFSTPQNVCEKTDNVHESDPSERNSERNSESENLKSAKLSAPSFVVSSPPSRQIGLSRALNAFPIGRTSPIVPSKFPNTSKYFSNQMTFGSPGSMALSLSFGPLDRDVQMIQAKSPPQQPSQELPEPVDSPDFEKSFEHLDLQHSTTVVEEQIYESEISNEQVFYEDEHLLRKDGSHVPIQSKATILRSQEVSLVPADNENSSETLPQTNLSFGLSSDKPDSSDDTPKFKKSRLVTDICMTSSDNPETSIRPAFKSSEKSGNSLEKDEESCTLVGASSDIQTSPEVFCSAPTKQERQAFVKSLFEQTPNLQYSPNQNYRPNLAAVTKNTEPQNSGSIKQVSEFAPRRLLGERILNENIENMASQASPGKSLEPLNSYVREDASEKSLAPPSSPYSSQESNQPGSRPFTISLNERDRAFLGSPSPRAKDTNFPFSLFDTDQSENSPKSTGNNFSIFGSPINSQNAGSSDDAFSLFGTGSGGFEPTTGTPDNNPFSFNFGKSPQGAESNFFSLFPNSPTSNDEQAKSQSNFKLF